MERLARLVVRAPWLVVLLWVLGIAGVAIFMRGGTAPKTPASQPTAAQRAYDLLNRSFRSRSNTGDHPPVSILLLAPGAVSPTDKQAMASLVPVLTAWDNQSMGWNSSPARIVEHLDGPTVSKDGRAMLLTITYTFPGYCYPECNNRIETFLNAVRPHLQPGATIELSGQGLIYQAQNKALAGLTDSGISPTLTACVILLLAILSFVYRAPLAVLMPLVVIGAIVYTALLIVKTLSIHTSWVAHGDITNEFVSVVLLGAGTNYCIFLLSRYREGLRDGLPAKEATVLALSRVGEAISSSAGTVIAAMALLGFTVSPMFRAIGPSVAIAVTLMLCAGLTLVPALMRLFGPALLWPSTPRPLQQSAKPMVTVLSTELPRSSKHESVEQRRFWLRVGALVAARPLPVALACLIFLLALVAFVPSFSPSYDDLRTLPSSDPAVRTAEAIQQHFGSASEPATLVIASPHLDLHSAAGARVLHALRASIVSIPRVSSVGTALINSLGHVAAVPMTLGIETSSPAAHALVDKMQAALATTVRNAGQPGLEALLSGDSAWTHDQRLQVNGDFRFIVLSVSVVILVILMALVRSLTAPIYLLLSVALSAGSAMGLTALIFHVILGQEIYYTTPVFVFVFLVALGEDFNILLMSRMREEIWTLGVQAGVARAVGRTGGTLSNCGLVMAGTFGVLMSFQVTFLQQVGFAIASGVVLDTFVVRPLLVPSIVCLLGKWNWVTFHGAALLPQPSPTGEETAA